MIKRLLFTITLFSLLATAGCQMGIYKDFYEQKEEVRNETVRILIKHGHCESKYKDCGYAYAMRPFEGGFDLSVATRNPVVVEEIKRVLLRKLVDTPEIKYLTLSVYHTQTTPPWTARPTEKIELRRD